MNTLDIFSPSDGSLVAQCTPASQADIDVSLAAAEQAQTKWQQTSLAERAGYCHKALIWFKQNKQALGREISQQMGRPIRYAEGEIDGLIERAEYMITIAADALADVEIDKKPTQHDIRRFIRPTPLGCVFVIAPWNYPYLTAINTIIPALMAGNTVILKHASQTLLCAERFFDAFEAAKLPVGVFQFLHLNHKQATQLIQHPSIHYVSFTGSVSAGTNIEKAAAGCFKPVALELGGKDAAYVRADADLDLTIESLVDGAFFNSGQSCCGIERIYVAQSIYQEFVTGFVLQSKQLKLGSALDPTTTIGPMVNHKAANFARQQILEAKHLGAKLQLSTDDFTKPDSNLAENYLAPQVLTEVNHSMSIMAEESFAPVVGIMPVNSDQEALNYINDSRYGLTASIWTQDRAKFIELANVIETGSVFMNRCDFLDPALAWVGVKDSGRGCSLSKLAYGQLTRPKSIYIKNSSA